MKSVKKNLKCKEEIKYPYLMKGANSDNIYLMTTSGKGTVVYTENSKIWNLGSIEIGLAFGEYFDDSVCLENEPKGENKC